MSDFHRDIARNMFEYYVLERRKGHTSLLASAIARELLTGPKCGVHVWVWTMKEAEKLHDQVRELLDDDPDKERENILLGRVRYFAAVGIPNVKGFHAPAFVDNHVVEELCIGIDQAHEEIRRTKWNAEMRENQLKVEIGEFRAALQMSERANKALWERRYKLEEQNEQLAGENALLAAMFEEEGFVL